MADFHTDPQHTQCDAVAATSLYIKPPGESSTEPADDKAYIMTLERSEAKYTILDPTKSTRSFVENPERPPQVVVQVRKRKGKIELFLDGYHSKGRDHPEGGKEHVLYWHSGLHEDKDTQDRALSPVAIVCAIEDGQRPLRGVRVGVWKTYRDGAGRKVHNSVLLTETNLSPHRVSDTRCRAACVPYPLPYQALPVVSIFDDRSRRTARNKKQLGYMKRIADILWEQVQKANANDNATLASKNASYIGYAYILGMAMPAAYYGGVTGALTTWAMIKNGSSNMLPKGFGGVAALTGFATSTIAGEKLTETALPTSNRVHFTLKELAKTLETISALLITTVDTGDAADQAFKDSLKDDPDDDEIEVAFANLQKKTKDSQSMLGPTDLLFWDWLTSKAAAEADTLVGIFSSDDLLDATKPQAALHVTIDVEDAFECDVDAREAQKHRIRCGRNDAYYLSNAAVGTLEDLIRVGKAIETFMKARDEAVKEVTGNPNFIKSALYSIVYNPIAAAAKYLADFAASPVGKASAKSTQKAFAAQSGTNSKTPDDLDNPSPSDLARAENSIKQLYNCFIDKDGNGMKLRTRIEDAVQSKGTPWAGEANGSAWVRNLPQRVGLSNFSYLFKAGQQDSTQHIDVETLSGIVREYTGYHDATQTLGVAMHSGEKYLRRRIPHWESRSATRVMLILGCTYIHEERAPHHREGDACFSTLCITTPVDIQFAGVATRFMDESLRCIRFVVKRAQQKCEKSLLEALGLKHTSEDLLACQIFGDLWADELVTLKQFDAATRSQIQVLEQASRRAAMRLRALGKLLLEVFTVLAQADLGSGEEYEVAPEIADISFRATLAGRDAARLLGRLLFARDDFEVRSVMTPVVRRSAAAAVRVAGVFERAVPGRLPHEPLASLFGDRSDCVAALIRADKLLDTGHVAAKSAMVGAYASSRLVSDEESDEWKGKLRGTPQPPWRDTPTKPKDMRAAMRYRMASLRIDYDVLHLANELDRLQVDGLATRVVQFSEVGTAFYIPFGFGDARPAPTLPPCSVPMFGTVPVLGRHLHQAFTSILEVLVRSGKADDQHAKKDVFCVRLEPWLRCIPHAEHQTSEETTAHPNIVHVFPTNSTLHDVKVRFLASVSRSSLRPKEYDNDDKTYTVGVLASRHLCDARTLDMTHEVSSLAWNAERVLQSIIAALASARDVNDAMKVIAIDMYLPSFKDYAQSWYNQRVNEKTDKLQLAYNRANLAHENAKRNKRYEESILDELETKKKQIDELDNKVAADNKKGTADPNEASILKQAERAYEALKKKRVAILKSYSLAPSGDSKRDNQLLLNHLDEQVKQREKGEEEAMKELKAAKTSLEHDAREAEHRASRMLIGAVGIGMAMASAIVFPMRVYLRRLDIDKHNELGIMEGVDKADAKVAKKFESCEAVRLSEACLVISQWW